MDKFLYDVITAEPEKLVATQIGNEMSGDNIEQVWDAITAWEFKESLSAED